MAILILGVGVVSVGVEPVSAAPAGAPRVTLLGDSTMAAMEWYGYDNDDADSAANNDIRDIIGETYDLVFSSESCRRLVNPSCRGRFGAVPQSVLPLMRTTLAGQLGDAVVIMAGYDDASITSAADAIMAEAESQGVGQVLWLTYRSTTTYTLPGGMSARNLYESHNLELAEALVRHPRMRILDWNGYTLDRTTWFSGDGIHLTRDGAVGLAQYIKTALDSQPVSRCHASNSRTGAASGGTSLQPAPAVDTSGYVPVNPRRVLDTRDPRLGGADGKLGAGRTVTVAFDGMLPANTRSVVLSVTAVDACHDGFLTVFSCGPRPATSSINYEVGRVTAGLAIATLTATTACIFSSAATDVIVDVIGAFTTEGQAFHPLPPTRWVDTRGGLTQLPTLVGSRSSNQQVQVAIGGQGAVPLNATGVWINLTIADPVAPTVLLAYPGPCGNPPLASTVNSRPGRSAASSALVGLGPDGSICIRTLAGHSHIVVDVAGWFGPGADGLWFQQRAQSRLLDTRINMPAPVQGEQSVVLDSVAILNITSSETAALGYVAARPCGTTLTSSLINTTPSENTANIAAVGPSAQGTACVRASVPSHLIVDQVGAFVPRPQSP